jgi:hypothetical protein
MRQPSPSPRLREPARSRKSPLPCLALAACALLAAGCEEERHVAGPTRSRAADVVGVDLGDQERVAAPTNAGAAARPQAKAPKKPQPIVGKRTQDIKDANAELKAGNAKVGSTRIVAKDPFTLQGNAYVAIIGRTSMDNMKHAVDLYHAQNDRYPKDLDEFMNEIIKPNNIALPMLPHYQEYGYDANEHKLIILEYPDRKNQPPQ